MILTFINLVRRHRLKRGWEDYYWTYSPMAKEIDTTDFELGNSLLILFVHVFLDVPFGSVSTTDFV